MATIGHHKLTAVINETSKLAALQEKIRRALFHESRTLAQLASITDVHQTLLKGVLRHLVDRGHVYNLGDDESPLYTWRVGAHASNGELQAAVARLIRERPMNHLRLQAATGASMVRVARAVRAICREPEVWGWVDDLGPAHESAWFLPPIRGGGHLERRPRRVKRVRRTAAPKAGWGNRG